MISEAEVWLKYIVLTPQDLRDIHRQRKSKEELRIKEIPIDPNKESIGDLLKKIQENEKFVRPMKLRAWRNPQETTMEKLHQEITNKCKYIQCDYRIAGVGRLMENEK